MILVIALMNPAPRLVWLPSPFADRHFRKRYRAEPVGTHWLAAHTDNRAVAVDADPYGVEEVGLTHGLITRTFCRYGALRVASWASPAHAKSADGDGEIASSAVSQVPMTFDFLLSPATTAELPCCCLDCLKEPSSGPAALHDRRAAGPEIGIRDA
jgi:hypothetical protein